MDDIPIGAWQSSLGNESHYLDIGFTPEYPFGFGLTYTAFTYSDLKQSGKSIGMGESIFADRESVVKRFKHESSTALGFELESEKYEVRDEIAKGGMGSVSLVRDHDLNRNNRSRIDSEFCFRWQEFEHLAPARSRTSQSLVPAPGAKLNLLPSLAFAF